MIAIIVRIAPETNTAGCQSASLRSLMRAHHTKQKGDLGVLYAQLDLAKRGYIILLPQTEHAPFDLVAYKAGRFLRVQVKYRAAVGDVIKMPMTTSWADRHTARTRTRSTNLPSM
jgi:hypothetical protein